MRIGCTGVSDTITTLHYKTSWEGFSSSLFTLFIENILFDVLHLGLFIIWDHAAWASLRVRHLTHVLPVWDLDPVQLEERTLEVLLVCSSPPCCSVMLPSPDVKHLVAVIKLLWAYLVNLLWILLIIPIDADISEVLKTNPHFLISIFVLRNAFEYSDSLSFTKNILLFAWNV